MVDAREIRSGVTVTLTDGSRGVVRGSYMSAEGIVIRVKMSADSVCDRNVTLGQVQLVHKEGR